MIKTQIQLEEWQHEKLKALSHRESRSIADPVRESVTRLLESTATAGRPGLEEIAGKYAPLDANDLKRHDRAWTDAIR